MANIPKAREILNDTLQFNMSLEVRAGINEALSHMVRVFENGKAPNKSRQMTKQLAEKAKELHSMFPKMTQQEIANALNVNAGRVSEALSGKYDDTH